MSEVGAYVERAPAERRAALNTLRSACRELLGDFEETIEYGMPSYKRDGVVEVAFASQKRYLSLYVLRTDVVAAHEEGLAVVDHGKGCIRFKRPDRIDWELVRSLLAATERSRGPIC